MPDLDALIRLATDLQGRGSMEDLLQTVVEQTARILRAEHASIRLLNPARTHLLAMCRTGEAAHFDPAEFRCGEGLLGWIAEHEKAIRTDDAETDPRFAPKPGLRKLGAFLGVPLISGNACVGVISVIRDDGTFDEVDEQLLGLVAAISAPHLEIVRLSRLSRVDPLTGALNRRGMQSTFDEGPMSVIMVDIDHFKQVNDEHGHAIGDEVLRHVARLLSESLRASDAIVRYGGEEFLLIFADTGLGRAQRIAERARLAVVQNPAPVGDGIAITVSMGVVERAPGESLAALIERADRTMYAAKNAGRNRVESG